MDLMQLFFGVFEPPECETRSIRHLNLHKVTVKKVVCREKTVSKSQIVKNMLSNPEGRFISVEELLTTGICIATIREILHQLHRRGVLEKKCVAGQGRTRYKHYRIAAQKPEDKNERAS